MNMNNMVRSSIVQCRHYFTSPRAFGRVMDSTATAKVTNAKNRMVRKFEELERQKLEKARKNALIERRNRTQMLKNYDKPHKHVIFNLDPKSQAFNQAMEEDIQLVLAHSDFQRSLGGMTDFQITKVRVHPAYKALYVFWVAGPRSNAAAQGSIGERIDGIRGNLRYELERLNCVGRVPELIFIKDEEHLRMSLLEDKFSEIQNSMGPVIDQGENICDFSLKKRSDILRFERDNVMEEVKRSLQKSKTEEVRAEQYRESRHGHSPTTAPPKTTTLNGLSRRSFIKKFIAQRNKDLKTQVESSIATKK